MINFTGISFTSPVHHINVTTAPGVVSAATYAATAVLMPAQVATAAAVTANAANQALIAQQAVAKAALVATLPTPTKFNSSYLPPEAKAHYENYLNPSYSMTKNDMQPFSHSNWWSVLCFVLP